MEMMEPMSWELLQQEKVKLTFFLPFKLHYLVLPLCRSQMQWQIRKAIHKHQLQQKLAAYPHTFSASVKLLCYIYRLSPMMRKIDERLLHLLAHADFISLCERYGDICTSAVLQVMLEKTFTFQDSLLLEKHLQDTIHFLYSPQFADFYQDIQAFFSHQEKEATNKAYFYLGIVPSVLINNKSMLDKYLQFIAQLADSDKILKFFEIIHSIFYNMNTSRSYEAFLQFSKKFYALDNFAKIVDFASILTKYGDVEVLQQTLSWATNSSLPIENIALMLLYAEPLLENSGDFHHIPFAFKKFFQYIREKEENFQQMEPDKVGFYLQKAIEFLIAI